MGDGGPAALGKGRRLLRRREGGRRGGASEGGGRGGGSRRKGARLGLEWGAPILYGEESTVAVDLEIDDSRRPADTWADIWPRWERRVGYIGGLFVGLWASSPT
jgi:hypothetical protein